jgi:hypothetical protein
LGWCERKQSSAVMAAACATRVEWSSGEDHPAGEVDPAQGESGGTGIGPGGGGMLGADRLLVAVKPGRLSRHAWSRRRGLYFMRGDDEHAGSGIGCLRVATASSE